MPQLWRSLSGNGSSRTPVKSSSETATPGPMKLILGPPIPPAPMAQSSFWPSSSAPSSPSSPEPPGAAAAGLNQSPHYDRLLNELRLAQVKEKITFSFKIILQFHKWKLGVWHFQILVT